MAFPHKPKATFGCWRNKKERRKWLSTYSHSHFFSPNQFNADICICIYIYISGSDHDGEKPIKSNAKTRLDAMIPSDPLTPLTMPSINTKVNPHSHATLASPHKPKATFGCWKNKKERRKWLSTYSHSHFFLLTNFRILTQESNNISYGNEHEN